MAQNDECGGSQSTKFIKIWISEKNFKILKKKKKNPTRYFTNDKQHGTYEKRRGAT